MATPILREEVLRLVRDQSAQIVEVLPASEYKNEHIAGALSLPLKNLDQNSATTLDRARPVVVYCHDAL